MPTREHGIYISALDVAFETTKALTLDDGTYDALRTSGRSVSWACGALLYASAKYAAHKSGLDIDPMIWNTLRRALIMRMMEAGEQLQADPNLNRAQQIHVEYELRKKAEDEGYAITHQLDAVVEPAVAGGDFAPVVALLAPLFGKREDEISRLRLHFLRLTDEARTKVIPDFISELDI